jgi:LTXXQ motif family protein
MIRPRIAVLVLALVPATLIAQRGGSRAGRRSGGDEQTSRPSGGGGLRLSDGDVEEMSPIKRLIDKRKDLKLSDAQVKQFKDLESEMKTRNEHMFKMLDSVRRAMTSSGRPSDDDRAHMASNREVVMETVGNIRLSYGETLKKAMELLDDGQKQKANELVAQLDDETNKTIREKLDPRGEPGDDARSGRPPAA